VRRLGVELPLPSVKVHRRPLAVVTIVTQLVTRQGSYALRAGARAYLADHLNPANYLTRDTHMRVERPRANSDPGTTPGLGSTKGTRCPVKSPSFT
jgi:hypothetical protein